MPEGPEIRIMARELKALIKGGKIKSYKIYKNVRISNLDLLLKQTISNVSYYGKKVLFLMDDYVFISSPTMFGKWLLESRDDVRLKIVIKKDGEIYKIYYADTMNFGSGKIVKYDEYESIINKLGPDLQREKVSNKEWLARYRRFNHYNICDALLKQEIFSGVGNYIKSEALYLARIYPLLNVEDLTDEQLITLKEKVHKVLKDSYKKNGMSIDTKKSNYISPSGIAGTYKPEVYMRKDLKHVKKIKIGKDGRTTWYHSKLQRE